MSFKSGLKAKKAKGVIDGKSEGGDCDEVNQEIEQNEVELDGMKKGAHSTGKVMHM